MCWINRCHFLCYFKYYFYHVTMSVCVGERSVWEIVFLHSTCISSMSRVWLYSVIARLLIASEMLHLRYLLTSPEIPHCIFVPQNTHPSPYWHILSKISKILMRNVEEVWVCAGIPPDLNVSTASHQKLANQEASSWWWRPEIAEQWAWGWQLVESGWDYSKNWWLWEIVQFWIPFVLPNFALVMG